MLDVSPDDLPAPMLSLANAQRVLAAVLVAALAVLLLDVLPDAWAVPAWLAPVLAVAAAALGVPRPTEAARDLADKVGSTDDG